MTGGHRYVMREQLRNQVPSIMARQAAQGGHNWDESVPLYAVVVITLVYLFAMALSA